jgi:putative transposase
VDTLGLVLKAFVTEAHYPEGTVACWLFPLLGKPFPRLRILWADGAYRGTPVEQAEQLAQFHLETIERDPSKKGFQRLPKRWVVERTFAWLTSSRRLSRDYEYWVQTSDAMIYAVMVRLMLRRLAKTSCLSFPNSLLETV